MKRFSILFAILIFSAVAFGQSYKSYGNSRFGYSISYLSSLKPQGEAANGDGQIFKNSDAEMRVYGSNLLLNETIEKEYSAILKEKGKSVTYKTSGKNFFVVSGKRNGKIFYQKTLENSDGAFITFMIEYKESKRSIYDSAVTKMVKSLKI